MCAKWGLKLLGYCAGPGSGNLILQLCSPFFLWYLQDIPITKQETEGKVSILLKPVQISFLRCIEKGQEKIVRGRLTLFPLLNL